MVPPPLISKDNIMDTQSVVDNMCAGYIQSMTGLDTEVTEPGNVYVKAKIDKTGNVNIDTASHDAKLIVKFTDDDDYDFVHEDEPVDLDAVVNRIKGLQEEHEVEILR